MTKQKDSQSQRFPLVLHSHLIVYHSVDYNSLRIKNPETRQISIPTISNISPRTPAALNCSKPGSPFLKSSNQIPDITIIKPQYNKTKYDLINFLATMVNAPELDGTQLVRAHALKNLH